MTIDIGKVKKHIKPKADSTLKNMRKDDLVAYIRCLEHNYNVAVSFNENQAKYIESLGIAPVVPGPVMGHDMAELCYRNGEQHMKEKIISKLMEHKTKVKGACHSHVVDIIKMVEGL